MHGRILSILMTLTLLASVGTAGAAPVAVTFTYMPPGSPYTVYLAGSFNNWNPGQDKMTDADGDGMFEIVLELEPGTYYYKFVVDDRWFEDPYSHSHVEDGHGGQNSVLVVPDNVDVLMTGVGYGKMEPKAAGEAEAATKRREAPAGAIPVTFVYDAGGSAHVYLAGSFNSWSPNADLMTDDDGDGVYEIVVNLEPGRYEYKFVRDGTWITDETAKEFSDDGYGGQNSVLVVREGEAAITAGMSKEQALEGLREYYEKHGIEFEPKTGADDKTAAREAPAGSVPVTFVYDAGGAANVNVAGTFNGWDQTADLMTDDDGDGVYELTLNLEPGRYEYKFVHNGNWLTDETAAEFSDDGFGGQNSVLTVPVGSDGLVVGVAGEGAAVGGGAAGDAGGEKLLKQVTFRFTPVISGVSNVFLAGTFNDWNDSKTRMTDDDGDGTYEATLLLPVGEYQYKFVADGSWITDETAVDFADDGFGGRNSVLRVDASYEDVKIELGDGVMMSSDIPFVMDYSMVNPLGEDRIEFRTRAHRDDVESVRMICSVDGGAEVAHEMELDEGDAVFQYYRKILDVPVDSDVRFAFEYKDGEATFYARPGGVVEEKPAAGDMFEYNSDAIQPFFTPDWAKDGVFYQIFPERFWNGDKSNDPDFSEPYYEGANKLPSSGKTNGEYFHLVPQWENVTGLTRSPYRTDGKPDYYSFYGGDIAGVMEKIPYLADLGVTIIYFNPLNQARSNHKYDPMDYLSIDPHFADEATFKEFTKKAHDAGIRIIVDMAFNHTGDWHFAFLDGKEKGRESKYWDWYEWKRWPLPKGPISNPLDYYDCWWGFGIHPNLNYDLSRPNAQENAITDVADAQPNQDLVEYILQVARYWLGDLDIDGFRLDVPNEVPFWFWKEFRRVCDETKPNSFLIGEIWGNAMPWLGPHCFHSTMNYKYFLDPVLKFIGKGQGSAAQFDAELAPGRSIYPIQATQVMMNLIGSHDTERFVTRVGNNDDRLMLAALFQMTYVGIPQVYYGDEVGLKGGKDPDCRRTFPWGWEDSPRRKKIHDFYKKAIAIRHKYSALRTGAFKTVLTDGYVYAFLREDDNDRIVVVLNNSGAAKSVSLDLAGFGFVDGAKLLDEMSGNETKVEYGKVPTDLGPYTGAVLVLQ